MDFTECLIAWNPNGEVKVGFLKNNKAWSAQLRFTCGGCFSESKAFTKPEIRLQLMIDFHTLVVRDGINPKQAHTEFLKINEYREMVEML